MITEDFVSFETAKLLKEKNCPDFGYSCICDSEGNKAQTQSIIMKWLREVHNIDIIAPPQYDSIKWTYSAIIFKLSIPCTEIRLNDNKDKKEEACEEAIKYCLEYLI